MLLIAHHHKLQHDLLMAFTFDIMFYLHDILPFEREMRSKALAKS